MKMKMLSNRPTVRDPAVIMAAIKDISINRLLEFVEPEDVDESIKEIAQAMNYDDDAYKVVRRLEEGGWVGCYGLVELMEEILESTHGKVKTFVKEWAKTQTEPCNYVLGDEVSFRGELFKVTKIDETTRSIYIGTDGGCNVYILPWEYTLLRNTSGERK